MQFKISCFEVKQIGNEEWQQVAEKIVLEKLVESFDPVTPILTRMLQGAEIATSQEIYRIRC
jgi:hypothetical protein